MESTSQDLSGYEIPTKSTVGNIGDIYTDLNTEIKYKCVAAFSYTGHNSLNVEYIWKRKFEEQTNSGSSSEICKTVEFGTIEEIQMLTIDGTLDGTILLEEEE